MDVVLQKFYNLFWTSSACRNIFLTHKDMLLEKNPIPLQIIDYYIPRIVLSNSVKQNHGPTKVNSRLENFGIELLSNLKNAKEQYLGEDRVDDLISRRFGKARSLVLQEHGENWLIGIFNEISIALQEEGNAIDILSKYELIPDGIESFSEVIERVEAEFVEEAKRYLKGENIDSLLSSVDDLSEFYNSIIKEALLDSNTYLLKVLEEIEDHESRLGIFDNLYEMGVLIGGKYKALVECTRCLNGTYSGLFRCDLEPSKLKFKCPNCGKSSYYLVPYQINIALYQNIIHQDGLLYFAVQYLLDRYEIKYHSSTTIGGSNEIDFLLIEGDGSRGFMEIKMFKNNRNNEVKVKNLLDTVSQVKKNRIKLRAENSAFDSLPYFIVSNYLDEEIYEKAREECKGDLKEYNIYLYSADKLLENIK